MKRVLPIVLFFSAALLAPTARASSFTNTASLDMPATSVGPGAASVYPSTINVSALSGTITKVTVTLRNINHSRPDDIEALLIGPTGAQLHILSDAGGTTNSGSNITIILDDAAGSLVPDPGPFTAGTFKPTSVNSSITIMPAPAPGLPYTEPAPAGTATFASVFNGSNPNGTWSLYIADDVSSGTAGSISGGWSLDITTSVSIAPTTTTIGSSLNPSHTGQSVTFTGTVRKTSDSSLVTSGTVTFKEGATTLAGPTALNGSGQASFATTGLSEGIHTITANYDGTASFGVSSSNVVQIVDNNTTVSSNSFRNLGSITIPSSGSPGVASVYPSHIFVSGLSGTISKVTLSISNLSHAFPDDLEMMVVGPGGDNLVFLTDAGGSTPANGVNLVFDDAAGNLIPDSGPLSSGTWRPTSVNSSAANFPTPAPTPYVHAAPFGTATFQNVFGGASPNGTWSLYVVDDVSGNGGTIAGGWGLTFTTTADKPTVTALASSQNPSLTGAAVVFTATVTSNGVPVTLGTVTFKEGATVLAGPLALTVAGKAFYTNSTFIQGNHVVTAEYSGSPGVLNLSNDSLTQVVDAPTTSNGYQFCNGGTITIPTTGSPGVADVYPSHITVSGLSNSLAWITVSLYTISHPNPDDIEILLVGPQGQRFVLMSDVGGANAMNSVSLTLDDTAGSQLPDNGAIVSGTFRPTSVNSTAVNFPSPAPVGPYNHPQPFGTATLASVFQGTDPNGTWSLYVVDDTSNGAGGTIGGWCLTLFSTPPLYYVNYGVTNNNPLIGFNGLPGKSYYVQRATVVSGPYTNITPALAAPPSGLIQYQDTNSAAPIRFYRTAVGP